MRERDSRAEKLRGTILHLHEILTMMARMAAATGDLEWEKRYREFEPILDAAIKEATAMFPGAYSGEAARETDKANIILVEMENRAFDLIRQGQANEAGSLLFSNGYERQKRIYAQGITLFAQSSHIYHRLDDLRGDIIHLEEVLTMSARMTAVTGDLKWERRYREFEPQLDAAIKEAIALSPAVHSGEAAARMDSANIKLVEMQNQALDSVRNGSMNGAAAILFGAEHEQQKQIYANAMADFASGLSEAAIAEKERQQRRTSLRAGIVILLIPLLIFTWFVIIRAAQRWRATQIKQNQELTQHAEELAQLNRSLDQKVAERTKDLEASRQTALQAKLEAEEAGKRIEDTNEALRLEVIDRQRADEQTAIFRQFTDSSGQGLAMATLDGVITYANPSLCRLLGEDKLEDLIGKTFVPYYPEELQQRIQNEIIPAVMERGQWVGELAIKSTDGKLTPTLENIFLIRDEKGNPLCLADIMTDISDRKRAEGALHRRTYDLGERVKELNCLYGAMKLMAAPDKTPAEVYQGIADLIPLSWQYPGITCARITINGGQYTTENYIETEWRQSAGIRILEETVGSIDVFYIEEKPTLHEGPFLKEERDLIDALAREIGRFFEQRRAEEALSASEHKYKTLLENIPQKIFSKDKDSVYVSCNENFARDLKIRSEEIVGMTDHDFFPKELAEKYRADDRKIMEHGKTEELDERYIEDDKEFTVHTVKTPIRDENGDITGILGLFWDITEQKRAEEALRESEVKFRTLVTNIEEIIYMIDKDGTILLSEGKGLSKLGLKPGQIVGKSMFEIYKDYPDVLNAMRKALNGETVSMEVNIGDNYFRGWYTPHISHEGEIIGLLGLAVNITERKRAEDAVRESEEKYRGLVENIDIGISMIGPQMEILSLNRKMKEWFPNIDPSRKAISDEFYSGSPDNGVFSYSLAAKTLKDGEIHEAVTESRAGDEIKSFRAVSFPINDKQGNVVAAIEIVEDITEKLKMEEEHARTDKLESIGTLAGGIAHDFNNLLAGFMGNISMAKMDIDPETKAYNALERAESASVRASRLTLQLLTFAKGGAPVKELTSIPELIEDTVSFALSGSNIKCDFQIPDDIWEVTVDKAQIGQAIRNLVQNAAQAMADGGSMMISVENLLAESGGPAPLDEGKYIKISVKDQGSGIAEEHLQKIFEPYFTTKEQGSGLGLPAVYSIVKNHAGHIDVDSEVGVGTTFSVYLPATEKEVSPEPAAEEKIISGKGRVLVMDDEEMIRTMLEEMLEIIGYEVECTSDGAEAIELFKSEKDSDHPFDVLIIDLTIPGGMGGKEAMARIREIDSEIKSIVSSGYSSDKVVANFREYGFTACLNKPYNTSQLSSVLDEVLTS